MDGDLNWYCSIMITFIVMYIYFLFLTTENYIHTGGYIHTEGMRPT